MADTIHLYPMLLTSLAEKEIDFNSDTFAFALVTDAYTPAVSHRYFTDISHEASGTGYTAGGFTLTTPTYSFDAGTGRWSWTVDECAFATNAAAASQAIIYSKAGSKPLVARVLFDDEKVPLKFTPPSTGIFYSPFAL